MFDCFDGTLIAYFKNATGISEEDPAPPTKTIAEIINSIWSNRDRGYNMKCLVKRLQRIEKEMSGEARTAFAQFIPDGDMGRYAKGLEGQLQQDFTGTMGLLRDSAFQHLLVYYQRRERVFYVAHQAEDEVSLSWLVRGGAHLSLPFEDKSFHRGGNSFMLMMPVKRRRAMLPRNRSTSKRPRMQLARA